jgi:hypothetical protein
MPLQDPAGRFFEELWERAHLGSARREAASGVPAAFQCMFAAGTAAAREEQNATAFSLAKGNGRDDQSMCSLPD